MVKKIYLAFLILIVFLLNGCFFFFEEFFYSSSIDERFEERNNTGYVLNTLPLFDTGSGDYSFIVITDTHLEDGEAEGLDRLPDFIKNNPSLNIKFVVVTGDITDEGEKEDYDTFLHIANELANIGVPFYPVIGNHDILGNGWKHWKENIGSTVYRIDDARTTLIMLDTANGLFGKAQLDWLEEQLKNTNGKNVFIFAHFSLFATGPVKYLQINDLNERARVTSILQNRAIAKFAGHSHGRDVRTAGNVRYITTEDFDDSKTYCLVRVTDSGISYSWGKL